MLTDERLQSTELTNWFLLHYLMNSRSCACSVTAQTLCDFVLHSCITMLNSECPTLFQHSTSYYGQLGNYWSVGMYSCFFTMLLQAWLTVPQQHVVFHLISIQWFSENNQKNLIDDTSRCNTDIFACSACFDSCCNFKLWESIFILV